jgi:hypothetical protein
MLRTCSRVIAAIAMAAVLSTTVQAADTDWKMYGAASVEGGLVCFYDANDVIRTPGLRVWTKCLLQKDMDALDMDSGIGKKITESAARRVTAAVARRKQTSHLLPRRPMPRCPYAASR